MDYTLVEKDVQLQQVLDAVNAADLVGMDTEFVAEDCYIPDLCLLQISTRDAVFLVDPKSLSDTTPLWELLVEPSRVVIVHAGREEVLFAYRATGKSVPRLFDVQFALGLVGGEYPTSYGKLLHRQLGLNVPKGETRTDWRKRPLTTAQMDYAALDVLHLPELHDQLTKKLQKAGRTEWLNDELLARQSALIETQEQESWVRLSGVQSLHGVQLAVVRELWLWRDQRAQHRNMPARRVLRDDLLIELARRGSSDRRKISQIRGLHHVGFKKFIPEIAACIERGKASEIPETPWSGQNKRPRPPALLQQFLTAAMSFLCRTNQISPAIVGTSDDVGKLASYWLDGRQLAPHDTEFPNLLRGWRAEMVGKPLYDIFAGNKGLCVVDPDDEMPLGLCDL